MSNFEKLGSLWIRRSKHGLDFMTGEINGQRVVIFPVRDKRGDKSHDYHVFKSQPMQKQERQAGEDESW